MSATSKLEAQLAKHFEDRDYYAALQIFKTLQIRFLKANKFVECFRLLEEGSIKLFRHDETASGVELANILLEQYAKAEVDKEEADASLLRIFKAFPAESSTEQVAFLRRAIKTTAGSGAGSPTLHKAMASHLSSKSMFAESLPGFVHSDDAPSFCTMLSQWTKAVYPSEIDLLLARAVLMCIDNKNLDLANKIFETQTKEFQMDSPLVNYLRFLLLTMEREGYPLFRMLGEKYAKSLQRDPSFEAMLTSIAAKYYNVKPRGATNPMASLFQSLMQ